MDDYDLRTFAQAIATELATGDVLRDILAVESVANAVNSAVADLSAMRPEKRYLTLY